MKEEADALAIEQIGQASLIVRGKRVLLDADLAALYGVTTKALNQAVKRNAERFPQDFMFRISIKEIRGNRSQFVTGSSRHRNPVYEPYVFTEHGAIMAAMLLNSSRATEMSAYVVRAFVRMRELLASDHVLAQRLAALERSLISLGANTRRQFKEVYDAIRALTAVSPKSRPIGFAADIESGDQVRDPEAPSLALARDADRVHKARWLCSVGWLRRQYRRRRTNASHCPDGVGALDLLPGCDRAREFGRGVSALNAGLLGSELQEHIDIAVSIDVLESAVHGCGFAAAAAEADRGHIDSRGIEGIRRPDGDGNPSVAERIDGVREAAGLDVDLHRPHSDPRGVEQDGDAGCLVIGLPRAIRTDNGVPFASGNALFGLSKLSVWWLRLGIAIERIRPGHPQQDGRHERMHLTLKKET